MNAAHAIQCNEVAVGPAKTAGDLMLEECDRLSHNHAQGCEPELPRFP